MNYEYKHRIDPIYVKAIQLAGEDIDEDLTNEQAKAWVKSLRSESCEHSGLNVFLKYKEFIQDLRGKVTKARKEYGFERVRDDILIDTALDLIASGYGLQQILEDLELFFVAYKMRLFNRN